MTDDTVLSPTAGRTIELLDGRSLGYTECGDPAGKPVVFFHGLPGSRFDALLLDRSAAQAGARVVGIDRPGTGLSDFKPGRQILDWPDGVGALADALAVERFAVLGTSGGAPYAAACAFKIPARLTACAIVSGISPVELERQAVSASYRAVFAIAQRFPGLLRAILWWSRGRHSQDVVRRERLMGRMDAGRPEPDRRVTDRPEIKAIFMADIRETFRQGSRGAAHDVWLFRQPWGFSHRDIQIEVCLWHGELDANIPVAAARAVARAIPNCRSTFYPDDGHLSVLVDHADEIVGALLGGPSM